MITFEDLYKRLLKASINNEEEKELEQIKKEEYDPYHLDCLLNPQNHSIVLKLGECDCPDGKENKCKIKCLFNALYNDNGNVKVKKDTCTGCSSCVDSCKAEKLKASRDILPALKSIHEKKGPVYALIAPAVVGHFSEVVTPGKLRTAFKKLGFDGMVEVALFADILTLKEALEFDKNINSENDYQLTSCCCPIWIAMIRKIYNQLIPHVPGAVSPMIACGRTIKKLHPDSTTIFIGPCIAKKAEAREPDLVGAIDYVLTFQEIQDVFDFAGIDPTQMEETTKDHSSKGGRIYARTGGVSEAVYSTLKNINPDKKISIKTQQANGVKECKAMINSLINGETNANFFEGMGCIGGCVGGPKAIINKEKGKKHVDEYGNQAKYKTPINNPYVIELLHRLGFDNIDDFLEHSDIFIRNF